MKLYMWASGVDDEALDMSKQAGGWKHYMGKGPGTLTQTDLMH